MKKLFFFAAAMFAAMTINATELFDGSHAVTWDTPLNLEAAKFADAQPGQKIVLTFTDAKEMVEENEELVNKGSVVEFKVLDVWDHLAGSREALRLFNDGSVEQFLTEKAVEQLKANGLQIVGKEFTLTHVELTNGKELKEGITVWTGFFWADNWSTLELYKEGYNYVDFSKIDAIRFYSEAANNSYYIKFMKGWDAADKFAEMGDMTAGEGYVELKLTDGLRTSVSEAGHWLVQFNKESIDPFNVTDIVLVPIETPTAIENTNANPNATKRIVNGQVVITREGKTFNMLGVEVR